MSTFNLNFKDNFLYPAEVDFSETAEIDDYREYFNFITSKEDSIDVVSGKFNFGLNSKLAASLNITESLNKVIKYIERFTSSLTVSESLIKVVKYNKVLSDSFTTIESLTKIIHYDKVLKDSLTLSDLLKKVMKYVEVFTSSFVLEEKLIRVFNYTYTSSISISEKITVGSHYLITVVAGSLTLTEKIISVSIFEKEYSSLTLVDIRKEFISNKLSAAISLSEIFKKVVYYNEILKDSFELDEKIIRVGISLSLSSSIELEESIKYILKRLIELSNSFSITQKLIPSVGLKFSSEFTASESLKTTASHIKTFEDTFVLTEKIISRGIFERVVSSLTLKDIRKELISVQFVASFTVEDLLKKIMRYNEVLQDSFSLVEKIIKVGVGLSLSASFVIKENIKYILKRLIDLVDSFSIDQKLTPLVGLKISAEISLSDLLKYIEKIVLIHTDSIVITQSTRYLIKFGLNNEFNLTDEINHIEQLKMRIVMILDNSFAPTERIVKVAISKLVTASLTMVTKIPSFGIYLKDKLSLLENKYFLLSDKFTSSFTMSTKIPLIGVNLSASISLIEKYNYYLSTKIKSTMDLAEKEYFVYDKPLKDSFTLLDKIFKLCKEIISASISLVEKIKLGIGNKLVADIKLSEVSPKKNVFKKLLEKFYMLTRFEFNLDYKLTNNSFSVSEKSYFTLDYTKFKSSFIISDKLVSLEVEFNLRNIIKLIEALRYIVADKFFISDSLSIGEKIKSKIDMPKFVNSFNVSDKYIFEFGYNKKDVIEIYDRIKDIPKEIILANDKILLRSSLYRIMQYNGIFSFVATLIPSGVATKYEVIYDEKYVDIQRTGNVVLIYPRNIPVKYIGFGTEQFSTYDVELLFYIFGTWEDLESIIAQLHINVANYIGGTDDVNLERTVWVKITSEKNLQSELRTAQKYSMHLEVMVYAPLKVIPPESE